MGEEPPISANRGRSPEGSPQDSASAPTVPTRVLAGTQRAHDLFVALAKAILLATGLLVLLWLLRQITWVLLFFVLALVLALALNAPVTWLERRRVPRTLAAVMVFAVLAGAMVAVGWVIGPPLVREVTTLLELLPLQAMEFVDRIAEMLVDYPEIEQQLRINAQTAQQFVPWVLGTLRNLWFYSLSLIVFILLGLVLSGVVLYMVIDPRPLLGAYIASLPPHLRAPGIRAFTRASQMVVGWVYASAIISAMKAIPAFFFLSWIGLPGALVWSVFTFVADLVPRLGFYLMIIPPVLVALTIDAQLALWVALFYWGVSEILGNFVAPRVQASTMNLHPVFLLFITLAMVAAFGVLGAIIASPVAGFIKAYYEEFYLVRIPPSTNLAAEVDGILARQLPSEVIGTEIESPGMGPVEPGS
jgi:putative permease